MESADEKLVTDLIEMEVRTLLKLYEEHPDYDIKTLLDMSRRLVFIEAMRKYSPRRRIPPPGKWIEKP